MDNFSTSFYANLAANLITGVLFGIFVAIWIGRELNKLQQKEIQKQRKKDELIKSQKYLTMLQIEIDGLLSMANDYTNNFEENLRQRRAMVIPLPYWEVLIPGCIKRSKPHSKTE